MTTQEPQKGTMEDTTAEKIALEIAKLFDDGFTTPTFGQIETIETLIHHQLQKAREEERERIEAVFKEHVPPHAMDLEDSVWLKRLLNKVFQHD